ncbi:MAG: hypothetical protein IPP40_10375 [bacterium]|nr:hypothetical protein [bacterium]
MGGAIANPWGGSEADTGYEGCLFSQNSSDSLGGAVALGDGEIVKKCVFDANFANGGALLLCETAKLLAMHFCL